MLFQDDGIELSAALERPEAHDGRRLAILLHGFTGTKDRPHNLQAAASMRDAGFATLRLDLYGHGQSGGEFRNHTVLKWISNTMTVIRWALEQGYEELYLSGHSQGGLVAALVAGVEPDRIRGLILRAPAFMIPQGARSGHLLGGSFDPERIPDEISLPGGVSLRGEYLRAAQLLYPEAAAARYRGPVLILHGDRDDVVPLKDSVDYAGLYARCDLKVLAGESHHFDQRPEEMKAAIRAWLTGRTA